MIRNFREKYLQKLIRQSIYTGLISNALIFVVSLIFMEDWLVTGTTFLLMVVGLTSYFLYFHKKLVFGLHFLFVAYLIVLAAISFTPLVQYPLTLGYPVILGMAILFFNDFKTRIFYTALSSVCCVITLVCIQQFAFSNTGPFHLVVSILTGLGFLICFFIVLQISTDQIEKYRNELEENEAEIIKQNHKLEEYIESNIQLQQFAHIASHDLKAPIRSINSFSTLLRRKMNDKLTPDEDEFLTFIESNGQQMAAMIDDLLAYSKVNSQKINISKINTKEILKDVLSVLKPQARDKNVSVTYDGEFPALFGDAIKIKRVFQNLISNAIKFSNKGADSFIKIYTQEENNKWKFYIKDNGIGIKQNQPDIFEPFVQLNAQSEYGGTGMGLSFCQKIIRQHGGIITYNSTYQEGTTFCFSIAKSLESESEDNIGEASKG